jgi:leucine dehydrogenase
MSASHPSTPNPPAQIALLDDPDSGLRGTIVLHSTALGPAAGGCRLWDYESDAAAMTDAMRLAEGMSYKNALADLPLGGGKAVLRRPSAAVDRAALFHAFGRAVSALKGEYVTAEDVGTSVEDMLSVAQTSPYVAGLPRKPGAPGGDPSPWTAMGVLRAMEVAVRRRLGTDLSTVTVAVQGLGHVGYELCRLLHEAGAKLVVADPQRTVAVRAAAQFGAALTAPEEIFDANADVFAPCALGAILDAATVKRLRAKVVCGAANNQLASPVQGIQLADRGVLYAPDYLVNAGGIINVAAEYLGWSEVEAFDRVQRIGSRLTDVLDHAQASGQTPNAAADQLAREIIAGDRPAALAA